jgi:ribose transport system permease protein
VSQVVSTSPRSDAAEERLKDRSRLSTVLEQPALWVAVLDILLILLFGAISPGHVFFNAGNFTNMALDSAQIVLIAAGLALLLGAGELDISVGANIILASVVGAKTMVAVAGSPEQVAQGIYPHLGRGLAAGIAVAVVAGSAFGLVNAFVVTQMRVNSFIATLGTLGIGTGAALVISGGTNVENVPPSLQTGFGVRAVWGIPLPALVTLICVVVLWLLVTKTRFGIHTLAIGSSRQAASRAGIRIERHVMTLFVIVGLLAGVAAVFDLSRFSTTNLSGHQTNALSAIAGAVIGGTKLFGGRVSITGAVFGAILASILETGLIIQGFSPFYQLIVVGITLIVAVYIRGGDAEGHERVPFGTRLHRLLHTSTKTRGERNEA